MPPSPSLRRSPGMELRGDIRKRGRSLEGGLSFKGRDDDLALFNEMQSKETENFLLQLTDDFEDLLSSRVKPSHDFKLGINIPARGESSDLLNADGNKNDYDWLLTPPDTPLFPSLDDEPEPVSIVHSSKDRSRPISISRSSTMERSQRSSRGSPSPQRLSPSPRSGSSTFRGRPFSAPNASPIHLRPSSPSRKPSPPPMKSSTPPRSSTPTSRRTSPGPGGSSATPGLRGTSPVSTSRGNSASPKIRAWQSNIPGFSLEAPTNLRTSLADRPASNVRQSSPASRTSRDSPSRPRRQSMSPTASRSISSSHSRDRDVLSSHSKGSLASLADDDADSLQSFTMSHADRPMSKRGVGGLSNNRSVAFSKKPTKTFSPSSAPKRSFDIAIRQMDRKSQNMFRPLLSNVPSSTFSAGKTSVYHRAMISRNSSVTTSSNGSSDQATSGAHDTEGGNQYQDDLANNCARMPFSDIQDEVFAFDKMDVVIEDAKDPSYGPLSKVQPSKPDKSSAFASIPSDSKESKFHVCAVPTGATSIEVDVLGDVLEPDNHQNSPLCSRCGCHYHADEPTDGEHNICPECMLKNQMHAQEKILTNSGGFTRSVIAQNTSPLLMDTSEESNATEDQVQRSLCRQSSSSNSPLTLVVDESSQMVIEQHIAAEHKNVYNLSQAPNVLLEMHKSRDKSDSIIDVAEGAGISLLLKRSSSVKGPIIHGRTFNSSVISYDDLSYARNLTSSMRSSTGHGSMSTSSSIDLASAKHGEMLMQSQLIGRRLSDTSSKPQSTVSSFSGTSMQVYQGLGASTSSREDTHEASLSNIRHSVAAETTGSPPDQILALGNVELLDAVPSFARAAISEEANSEVCMSSGEKHASILASHMKETELDNSQVSKAIDEGHIGEDLQQSTGIVQNVEELSFLESPVEEDTAVSDHRVDLRRDDPCQPSLSTITATETDDSHPCSPKSHVDMVSREDLEDPSDFSGSSLLATELDPTDGIAEGSTVMVDQGGRRTRSMTIEEATDAILFCSSIVHDLAYKAASIAIEKEKENLEPLECSRPTVTIPERYRYYRRDPPGITTSRAMKTRRTRKNRAEIEAKSPLTINEEISNDERSGEPVVHDVGLPYNSDSMKPPKLESKCNCTIM